MKDESGLLFELTRLVGIRFYFSILATAIGLLLRSAPVYAANKCSAIFADQNLTNPLFQYESLSDPRKLLMIKRALSRDLTGFEISVLLDVIHLPFDPITNLEDFNKEADHRYQIKYFLTRMILPKPIFDQLFMDGILSSKWHAPSKSEVLQIQTLSLLLDLSDHEVNLLNRYSADLYYDMNRFEIDPSTRKKILKAISKLPNFKGTIYRGISRRHVKSFTMGQVIETEAIWSASKNREIADNWIEDRIILVIETSAAKVLGLFARFPSEDEVLLLPGTKLKVRRIENGIIYMSDYSLN